MILRFLWRQPGIRLGLLLAGITFFGLLLVGQRQPKTYIFHHITVSDARLSEEEVTREYARLHSENDKKDEKQCIRYLGLQDLDLVWGRDPKPIQMDDPRLPYGLLILPLALLLIVLGVGFALSRTSKIILP